MWPGWALHFLTIGGGVPIAVSVATTLALVVVYQPLRCATFDDSTYLRGP